jgi:HEAT repeat protein
MSLVSKERDAIVERLANADTARDAALTLRAHPEWLVGRPPIELLTALTDLDYDVEAPIFEVARAWERDALARALVAALRDEPDVKLREHGAWLLKHLGSPSVLPALADMVSNEAEPPAVRRWLLEAIERLVASRSIGWREVGDLVTNFLRHSDPSLRDGVIGIIASLPKSEDKRRLLLETLRTDDDEVVLASAVHALTSVLPIELDPALADRLLGHPSARVQRSVVEFIERSKRSPAKNG